MRFAIFGTGGVGGYFGGRLAQAGQDVSFLARGAHLQAIQQQGLKVESIAGDFVIHPAQASDNPAQIGPVDVVLVATKAWQVAEAAKQMSPMIGPKTMVLPLQNGVNAPEELGAALGMEHVLGGFCRISSFLGGPGIIQHVDVRPYLAFGELNGKNTERVRQLQGVFENCEGMRAEISADIEAGMWDKFIFICAVSGVSAVTRQPIGGFRDVPASRKIMIEAIDEAIAVGKARGIHLPTDQAKKTLEFIDQCAYGLVPSMQKDILEDRPSELESQTGAILRMAQKAGIPAPTHAFIYACLLPGELKARKIYKEEDNK